MTELDPELLAELTAPQITRIQVYCNSLFDLLDREGVLTETEQGEVKIWKGYLTKACNSVEIPEGVRNRVVKRLGDVGSIQVVEQGRRNTPSLVAVFYPPTPEVWDAWDSKSDLTDRPDPAILAAEVKSLKSKVAEIGGVDLGRAFYNIEQRLQQLEADVRKLLRKEREQEQQ